jgi:hypothetical protein
VDAMRFAVSKVRFVLVMGYLVFTLLSWMSLVSVVNHLISTFSTIPAVLAFVFHGIMLFFLMSCLGADRSESLTVAFVAQKWFYVFGL